MRRLLIGVLVGLCLAALPSLAVRIIPNGVTGGDGGGGAIPNEGLYNAVTNPVQDDAFSSAVIDAYAGTVVTLTSTQTSQDVGRPTDTSTARGFSISLHPSSTEEMMEITDGVIWLFSLTPGDTIDLLWIPGMEQWTITHEPVTRYSRENRPAFLDSVGTADQITQAQVDNTGTLVLTITGSGGRDQCLLDPTSSGGHGVSRRMMIVNSRDSTGGNDGRLRVYCINGDAPSTGDFLELRQGRVGQFIWLPAPDAVWAALGENSIP